ncbi:DUF1656 domain-containing protein [Caballeronia sp. LZ043]|uniref:DUF1656 domain-containing protein n=1 Tax=Caballeronia sp. LZ043 TaxID=3038569 RepID=UPI0028613352|nr:DUF1656 domain-containing protein [Caballeronia sp. LZ043]MDR5826206.1 DUF1656 domain-containing protein [Caballeronia sp. LZ043]
MLSEFNFFGIYLPPFFVYSCVTAPIFFLLRALMAKSGVLHFVWHAALFEFSLSVILLSALILYV